MFPNVDNNFGINAITDALNSRAFNFQSADYIVQVFKICLKKTQFKEERFFKIHWTVMGPKKACSYADLAIGIMDKKSRS